MVGWSPLQQPWLVFGESGERAGEAVVQASLKAPATQTRLASGASVSLTVEAEGPPTHCSWLGCTRLKLVGQVGSTRGTVLIGSLGVPVVPQASSSTATTAVMLPPEHQPHL
jgi:hypothetical protein